LVIFGGIFKGEKRGTTKRRRDKNRNRKQTTRFLEGIII